MDMKTNEKPKKRYRDMDFDEKFEYNNLRMWDVIFISIPIVFIVRYILLDLAVDHFGYTIDQTYPVWWCFKVLALIIVSGLAIYFQVRTPFMGGPRFGG